MGGAWRRVGGRVLRYHSTVQKQLFNLNLACCCCSALQQSVFQPKKADKDKPRQIDMMMEKLKRCVVWGLRMCAGGCFEGLSDVQGGRDDDGDGEPQGVCGWIQGCAVTLQNMVPYHMVPCLTHSS